MSAMFVRFRSRESANSESGRPCENAKPALVVASAGNPRCCRYRAEPTSHGFGITKQSASCSVRKACLRTLKSAGDPEPFVPTRVVVNGRLTVFIACSNRLGIGQCGERFRSPSSPTADAFDGRVRQHPGWLLPRAPQTDCWSRLPG